MISKLKHEGKNGGCGHEWDVSVALAEAVRTDINGGVKGSPNPPVKCPNCKKLLRHHELKSTIVRDDGQALCSDREEAIALMAK